MREVPERLESRETRVALERTVTSDTLEPRVRSERADWPVSRVQWATVDHRVPPDSQGSLDLRA